MANPLTSIDLNSLSREEKHRLLALLREKKRRLRENQDIYTPNAGQLPVHECRATLRCVFSGNGAGKTAMAVHEAMWAAQGFNPITEEFSRVPARVIVLLDHPEKVEDVWLPELRKWFNIPEHWLQKRGKPYYTRVALDNGSEILFMFHQQEPMLFESIELDFLVADEPPPRHVYVALRRGGRKKGRVPRFLLIGTPITAAWMRTEIFEPWQKGTIGDTECFRFGTVVNESNLADGYVESFSAVLSEKERRIRLEGEFFDLEGLALAHLFHRDVHLIEPFDWPDDWPVVVAIDPHTAKAHHACMLGVDGDGLLYYIRELKRKVVPRQFARELADWMGGARVVDIVSDSLGKSEYTGGEGFRSFIQVMRDEGVNVRATTWAEKSDEDFVSRIRSALYCPDGTTPKLRVFQGNWGIVHDIENCQFQRNKSSDDYKPKLDIANTDFLSCLKYALATNLFAGKVKAPIVRRHEAPYGVTRRPMYQARRIKMEMLRDGIKKKSQKVDEFGDPIVSRRKR